MNKEIPLNRSSHGGSINFLEKDFKATQKITAFRLHYNAVIDRDNCTITLTDLSQYALDGDTAEIVTIEVKDGTQNGPAVGTAFGEVVDISHLDKCGNLCLYVKVITAQGCTEEFTETITCSQTSINTLEVELGDSASGVKTDVDADTNAGAVDDSKGKTGVTQTVSKARVVKK